MTGSRPNSRPCLTAVLLALLALFAAQGLAGCAVVVTSATQSMTEDLTAAVLNNNDPATVREGAPAYLLMVDGFIRGNPGDEKLLLSGANLYSAYGGLFVEDKTRLGKMTDKALEYAKQAHCVRHPDACDVEGMRFDRFVAHIEKATANDVETLYTLGSSWAAYIRAHKDDWLAVAHLSKVEAIMRRVVELDESHAHAGAHLYLGTLASLTPAALGGKPEVGEAHFQQAIELTDGKNLLARVLYARQYARLVFDRELHDRLLNEVLEADPEAPGLTLTNVFAQKQARELLESADKYF
ncbi:MAG: TRAP transporter TatT component family protein [Desulfatibacillaceae bacterium]